jgi:hypothetical protein
MQRAARGCQGIHPALDLRIVDQRRGVVRLDSGVDHERARASQCLSLVKAPRPSMSDAGFERVKVTQRRFRSLRAANSLSSTITINGKKSDFTPGQMIVPSGQFPGGIYAPFLHPWSTGRELYFNLSEWNDYNVMLMKTVLP